MLGNIICMSEEISIETNFEIQSELVSNYGKKTSVQTSKLVNWYSF